MGVMVGLECPNCGLRGQNLLCYSGFVGLEYTPAWCATCGNCVSAHTAGGRSTDQSRLRRCPHCSGEVSLFDMENPVCHICSSLMDISYIGLWD